MAIKKKPTKKDISAAAEMIKTYCATHLKLRCICPFAEGNACRFYIENRYLFPCEWNIIEEAGGKSNDTIKIETGN